MNMSNIGWWWGLILAVGGFLLLIISLEALGRKVRELEKRIIVLETKEGERK